MSLLNGIVVMKMEKTEILTDLYSVLEPAVWIANFKDGSTITSKTHESFNDIPIEDRTNIVTLQLKIDDNRYIINRKLQDDSIVDGFFYHIKEGRHLMMGAYQGTNLEFFAERIGFCYNNNGDSVTIRVDHGKLVAKIGKRMRDKIEPLIDTEKEHEIDKLLNKPIKYSIQSDFYHENIVEKRLNIALFGQLDQLEEMGTPPRSYMNNEEIVIAQLENIL